MMASHIILEEKFIELQKAEATPKNSLPPKIQRVPNYLRNRKKFKEHYSPKLVSIGPIHHDNPDLKLGEKFKLMWAAQYIKNTQRIPQNLYKKIAENIGILKDLFSEDVLTSTGESLEGFGSLDEKLSWMLFVDGCSLLHILAVIGNREHLCFRSLNIKLGQLFPVMMDIFLLENQLPYLVLKLLWENEENDNESKLKITMQNFLKFSLCWATSENETYKSKDNSKNFLKCHNWITPPDIKRTWGSVRSRIQSCFEVQNKKKEEDEEQQQQQHSAVISIPNDFESELPTYLLDFAHLLDLQRKIILTKSSSETKDNEDDNSNQGHKSSEKNTRMTYRNVQDLRRVGIKLTSSATQGPIDINFSEGWFDAKLTLPEIIVDDSTASTFLNLIAYEMCPDFDNDYEISSFVCFMDSLIDNAEDVKELRSQGILRNCLGSDEEVTHLFNIISNDLVDNIAKYLVVRAQIHEHYRNKYKTWIALGIHTYFDNPWTFIAFLAAFIALTLTFVQTWFTITPPK